MNSHSPSSDDSPGSTEPPDAAVPHPASRRHSWRHGRGGARGYVAELVLIAAGVLLALGAEATWSFVGERLREADWIRQLREDTRENRDRALAAAEADEVSSRRLLKLYAALGAPGPLPPETLSPSGIG